MKRLVVILGLCVVAAGCTQTRVVHDNSVAAQFAAFNKNGWSVTGGGIKKPGQVGGGDVRVISSSNPLSHPVWKTNFQVDPADKGMVGAAGAGPGSGVAEPPPPMTPGSSLMGGFVVPGKPVAPAASPAAPPATAPAR